MIRALVRLALIVVAAAMIALAIYLLISRHWWDEPAPPLPPLAGPIEPGPTPQPAPLPSGVGPAPSAGEITGRYRLEGAFPRFTPCAGGGSWLVTGNAETLQELERLFNARRQREGEYVVFKLQGRASGGEFRVERILTSREDATLACR